VKITASDSIKFNGISSAQSGVLVGAVGNAGGVEISTKTLELLGGSGIITNTAGTGNAGTVKITASDSIKFNSISTAESGVLAGAEGKAGGVEISTKTLELLGGSKLLTSTAGKGDAGTVKITASDSIKIDSIVGATSIDGISVVASNVANGAIGNAGGVEISTKTLVLLNGSALIANTSGKGDAGTVKITASDSTKFDGISGVTSSVEIGAIGNAGGVEISTKTLELLGGSGLTASTLGQGDAGTVKITATDFIKLTNGSRISSSTSSSGNSGKIEIIAGNSLILDGNDTGVFARTVENSTGKGGSIFIDPPLVSITNGAKIVVESLGTGNGGDLTIIAGKFVFENNSLINANTASGEGGNINLQIADIFFPRNNSNINATAGGTGNGGNINLSALFTIAIPSENNDIYADASFGKGGNINLTTQAIFGLQFRPRRTDLSDITASSEFGVQGNVNINTPGVDPSKGLSNLPVNISDASKLVTQRCLADRQGSAFVITGRGGIPISPANIISSINLQENIGTPSSNQLASQPSQLISQSPNPPANRIVEAQGWTIKPNGQVSLVAEVNNAIPTSTWARQLQCR
jgi:large exoprotein involved in heme utilization and adhesion